VAVFSKIAEKLNKKNQDSEEITIKSYDEKSEQMAVAKEEEPVQQPAASTTGTSIKATASNIELKVVHPESFDDVSTIADYLLDGCTVILNLELFDPANTLRMLDFLNGVTYSTGGDIKQVAQGTYIITPHNVDVTGEDA
jgi:cell division inhibitor SepF